MIQSTGNADRPAAIVRVETWARERLDIGNVRAHGWLHTDRVRCNILPLASAEGVSMTLAELAALLHDVGRTQPGPESEHGIRSADMARPVLGDLPLTDKERAEVLHAVRWHNSQRADTTLLCVLRDADMLDGLGCIGIMRALVSKAHLPPYDPAGPFDLGSARGSPVFISDQIGLQLGFYDWLNTDAARQMAADRVEFMNTFVAQMRQELLSNALHLSIDNSALGCAD